MGQVIEEKLLALFGGPLGWVDIAYVACLLWGAAGGLRNGLKGEIGKFIFAWLAILVAMRYSASLSEWVTDRSGFPFEAGEMMIFISLTLLVYFAGDLITAFSARIARLEFFSALNRIGGVVLGVCRMTVLLFAFSRFALGFPSAWIHDSFYERSITGTFLGQGADLLYDGTQSVIPLGILLPRPWDGGGGGGAPAPPSPQKP